MPRQDDPSSFTFLWDGRRYHCTWQPRAYTSDHLAMFQACTPVQALEASIAVLGDVLLGWSALDGQGKRLVYTRAMLPTMPIGFIGALVQAWGQDMERVELDRKWQRKLGPDSPLVHAGK